VVALFGIRVFYRRMRKITGIRETIPCMDRPPLKRLYLDSTILGGWPNCHPDVRTLLAAARQGGVQTALPQVVEDELEEQFLMANGKSYDMNLAFIFRAHSKQLKNQFGIESLGVTGIPLSNFLLYTKVCSGFGLLNLDPARGVVVNLGDAALLYSVFTHVAYWPPKGRCALASSNPFFTPDLIDAFMGEGGFEMECLHGVGAVMEELHPETSQ
jgi:hypothetical protein